MKDVTDYADRLRAVGAKVLNGSQGTLWVTQGPFLIRAFGHSGDLHSREHGACVVQRRPYFALHTPEKGEVENVFHRTHVPVLNFPLDCTDASVRTAAKLAPGPIWFGQGYLYVCSEYSPEKLGQSARSHLRRALNEFEFRFIDEAEIFTSGIPAFRDTRLRFGLAGEPSKAMQAILRRDKSVYRYIGAFKDAHLAAFLAVAEVDDWATIGPIYAMDEFLSSRPNNGLHHFVLQHYLVERKFRLVDHGLSNFPITPKVESLHRFKVKIGFKAVPIYRAFLLHPLLQPVVNRVSWKITNALARVWPHNSLFRKAEIVLRMATRAAS